ncbi:MAG: DNA polymerase III subunit beta [Coprobacillus sp.]|nr:DNA polymerase III subunit beta [Coprobacillus sp.]
MRFTVKRDELVKGLNSASRAVSSKNTNPVLATLKFDLNEEGLFVLGSNGDYAIRTKIPYKDSDGNDVIRNYEFGSVLINSKIVCEIARKTTGEELTFEVLDSTVVNISDSKKAEYQLNCIRSEEYVDFDLETEGTSFELPTSLFAKIVEQTAFAASTKDQRPILTAVNLEAADGTLTATATDSARMARKTTTINPDLTFSANIPAKILVEIEHLAEGSESVSCYINSRRALFTFGDTIVSTSLISGEYPNTKNIVPKVTNYTLEVNAKDLISSIEGAVVLNEDNKESAVELFMSPEAVDITSRSQQQGSSKLKVEPFRFEGQNFRVAFNSQFVIQAINAVGSEDVTFLFVGEMKPFVVKNNSDDSIVEVVTPVRTY